MVRIYNNTHIPIHHVKTHVLSCYSNNFTIFSSSTHKGNLQCEGETLFEQKERCHYEDPERCRPTAKLILEQLNISTSPGRGVGEDGLCTCKFRRGLRVCADSELNYDSGTFDKGYSEINRDLFLSSVVV